MALACDRCLSVKQVKKVATVVKKFDGNRLGRRVIQADAVICDECLKEYLKALGRFHKRFMNEGDEPEAANEQRVGTASVPNPG